MQLRQVITHSMRKSGLPTDTEFDIYGLVLKRWNLDTNLQVDMDLDYHRILKDVPAIIASTVVENIKDLNSIFLELTRLYPKLKVTVHTTAYYFKIVISCYG